MAVGIGAGLVLVWFTMVPPHAVGTAWRVVGVLLVVGAGWVRYRVHYVRIAVGSWRSLFWGVLTAVLLVGYALLYPGVGVELFAMLVVGVFAAWFVAVLVVIAFRFREHRADAVAGSLAIVVVGTTALLFGATPGRQLRLLTVQDRYESAIASGRVGDEAGTSDGDLAAWVWVDGHNSAVAGVVFDPADNLVERSSASALTVGSVGQVADCSRLQETWFWCDFEFDPDSDSSSGTSAARSARTRLSPSAGL
ncbi:MAG: hypothetical protein R8G01_22275 [Ilumatobacteraceae bacterium]|nr:hypothetical protein [Ilumatobacteraceae bacterium]